MTDEVKEIETGLSILANYGAPMSGAQWDKFSNACLRSVATSRALQADLQSVRRLTIKYHGLGMKDPAQWRVGLEEIASVVAEEGAEIEPDTLDAAALQEENERLREALKRVRRGPVKPLPDPGAHSWSAFGQAAFQAMRDLQHIASKALAGVPSGLAASTIKDQSHD